MRSGGPTKARIKYAIIPLPLNLSPFGLATGTLLLLRGIAVKYLQTHTINDVARNYALPLDTKGEGIP